MSKPLKVRFLTGFTLIELVIVIGILAILAVVIILVLNPSEFLRQARDSTRMSDLQTLHSALGQYQADGGTSLGSSNKVYVSIPSSQTDCSDLGLPTLPDDWAYKCSNSTNYRKTEGSGWIPVLFSNISYGNVLNILPIDPVNATSTGNYYTYVAGGSWNLSAFFESEKYKMGGSNDKTSKDGGSYPELYEIGTNLTLLPVSRDPSLVGYWKLDDGSGSMAYDASGKGNNGTLYNSPTWTTGKVGTALSFDGSHKYVRAPSSLSLGSYAGKDISYAAWIKPSGTGDYATIIALASWNLWMYELSHKLGFGVIASGWEYLQAFGTLNYGEWQHVAIVSYVSGATRYIRHYINGVDVGGGSATPGAENGTSGLDIGSMSTFPSPGYPFNGLIDDVRIYNRALSAAEIAVIYNATK